MRLKTLVLASSSLLALAGIPAPAQAQTESAPAGQQDAGEDDEGSEIIVSGIRQSLQSSQSLKRKSDQIVDAIVAEDIGKLPDIALSDTAARIVGVQVDRSGGEAGRVLVRGLPDFNTSYNGREIFTAETRQVALQDFPSGAIGAIEVYKASTADLIEPGLAGLINVRSRRPFDFDGFEVAGSAWGLYTYQADKFTPNGNILITDRWDTGIGEIGVLVGASYTQLKYKDSERSNTDFIADPNINGQTVRFPDVQRINYSVGDRARPSANASVQWRPAAGLEFYVEGLYQGFRNKVSDRNLTVPLWGGASYSNIVLQPGTNLVQSGTVVNPFRPDGFQGATYNKTDTYQFALGGSYEDEGLKISGDLARTDSTFTGSTASVDYNFANSQTVNFNLNTPEEEGGAEFSFLNFDAGNPANYRYRGFYEEAQQAKGDDWQGRFDLSYDTGVDFLKSVQAGFRFTDRNAHREFGNRYWDMNGRNIMFGQVPLDYQLFDPGFRGSDVQAFRTWLAPTYQSVRDNLVKLREFNIAQGGGQPGNASTGIVAADPLQTYDANEKTYAGYGQIHYEIGGDTGLRVDGVLGMRVTSTQLGIAGTSSVNGVNTAVDVNRSYWDWLPNASARIRFDDKFALRLSATKTRTKPTFGQLNPSANFGSPGTCTVPPGNTDPYVCARVGSGGNPYLNPFTSNNYDASLEYYFSPTGFASAAVFRRDLNGFIQPNQVRYTDAALGPVIINGNVNAGRGRIDGWEAQFQTFFDVFGLPQWARAFGVQANVTYLDAKTDQPTNTAGVFVRDRIVGVSKWSYNLAGIYENAGLSLRLSYNTRSGFLATRQPRGDDVYRETVDTISRLDFSGSYDVIKNVTLFADWTNILNKPLTSRLYSARAGAPEASFPRVVRYEEMTASAGVRFRF
jgi:iron complex outermembrane receptor protein